MQKFNDNIYKNQRNEEQIMSNWRGNINNPKVTINRTPRQNDVSQFNTPQRIKP